MGCVHAAADHFLKHNIATISVESHQCPHVPIPASFWDLKIVLMVHCSFSKKIDQNNVQGPALMVRNKKEKPRGKYGLHWPQRSQIHALPFLQSLVLPGPAPCVKWDLWQHIWEGGQSAKFYPGNHWPHLELHRGGVSRPHF
eukprot:1158608-Pelagomonas_calceolata.AAC.6